MSGSMLKVGSKRLWMIALCMSAALASSASFADNDKHRGNDGKHRAERSHWGNDRHHDRRHDDRRDWGDDRRHHDDDRRHHDDGNRRDWDRRSYWRDDRRHDDRGYRGRDWRYHNGRYWAPAHYRGRYCNDRHHYHGVHYHVAANDYYDYYYPRYRYYGPRPYGANASVIISIPLF